MPDIEEVAVTNPGNLQRFLATMRRRHSEGMAREERIRRMARENIRFAMLGEHWDEREKRRRKRNRRPCLVMDKVMQSVHQVTNDYRKNRPAPIVSPVGGGASKDTAEVLEGIIRHVDVNSDGGAAKDTAFTYAAVGGFGCYGFTLEYCHDRSFDLDIAYRRFEDPFSVLLDGKRRWGFVREVYTRDAYREKWPKSKLVSVNFFEGRENPAEEFVSEQNVVVAEYWYIVPRRRILQKLSEPIQFEGDTEPSDTVFEDEYEALPEGVKVVKTRTVMEPQVRVVRSNGVELLPDSDGDTVTEWPGRYIPLLQYRAEEVVIDGELTLVSLVEFAKDPQRYYDYLSSKAAEAIALAPLAPFIGVVGQFKTKSADWQRANIDTFAYLEYDKVDISGTPAPPPQRNPGLTGETIAALTQSRIGAEHDVQASMGIYANALGERQSANESGKAVMARINESDIANYHLTGNANREEKYAGRLLLDLIKNVYTEPGRVARIVKPDRKTELVVINQLFDEHDRQKAHYVNAGEYDYYIAPGPSYDSARKEAVQSMLALGQAAPELLPRYAYLMVKYMDWPGADAIADALMPADVRAQQAGANPQVMQLTQQLQAQQKQILGLNELLTQRQIEAHTKILVAKIQAQTQVAVALAKSGMTADAERMWAEIEVAMHKLELEQRQAQFTAGQQQQQQLNGQPGLDSSMGAAA